MGKYDAYIARVNINGNTFQEDIRNATYHQAEEFLMNSPARETVEVMQLIKQSDNTFRIEPKENKYCIVSDDRAEPLYKKTILFSPDEQVKSGTYIKYRGKVYLVTVNKDVEFYPESVMELCNYDVIIKGEKKRVQVGVDEFGKPKYEIISTPDYLLPSVYDDKIYSALDNSQISNPVGATMLYLPYHKEINIPVNYNFIVHGDNQQVTTIGKSKLLKDENGEWYGCLEVRLQRGQNDS